MRNLIVITFIFLGINFCVFTKSIKAQKKQFHTQCGYANSILDGIRGKSDKDDLIILIARSGDLDTNPNVNLRRLHNIKTYLAEAFPFSSNADNIITAVGADVKGLAVIDIYFKGKNAARFYMGANRDLLVGDCFFDTEKYKSVCEVESQKKFYPCLDKRNVKWRR